jgi:hypothetical protein
MQFDVGVLHLANEAETLQPLILDFWRKEFVLEVILRALL